MDGQPKSIGRRVVAALLCLACALAPASFAAAAELVKLGINYPLTGPYSVEGLDQIRAARMAVDEINARGGILGRRVQLVCRDSGSDVRQTKINVRELIEEGCRMVFGGSSSAVAIEAARICQKHNVPFFGTLTYSTAFTVEDAHRVSFRECSNSWMAAKVMADWLNSRFAGKRYFYITADYTWGWTTEESLRAVTGTTDMGEHPQRLTALGATDFVADLSAAARANPEVLVLVLFGKDLAFALRQALDLGLNRRCQIVVPNLTLGMAERTGAKAMEGVVGTTPWDWTIPYLYDHPRGKAFVEAFVNRFRRYPSTSGASAYTIVYEYAAAVERADSLKTADVVRALEGHTYKLLKDEQTWRAFDHQSIQTMYMVQGNSPERVLADPLRQDFFTVILGKPGLETERNEEEWRALRTKAGRPPALEGLVE